MLKVKIFILLADKIRNIWNLDSPKNMHTEGYKIFAFKWEDGILCESEQAYMDVRRPHPCQKDISMCLVLCCK